MIVNNDSDQATLSVGTGVFAPGLPVQNLQIYNNARLARCTTPAESVVLGSWGKSFWLTSATIWRHTMTSAAKWRLELFAEGNQTGDLVYDSGFVFAAEPKALNDLDWGVEELGANLFTGWVLAYSSMWFERKLARSFRLTFQDPGNLAGYFDIGRLYLGRHIEPEINISKGHELAWNESTKQRRSQGGTLRGSPSIPYRSFKFDLDWIHEDERGLWLDMTRQVGLRKDIFLSAYPEQKGYVERDYSFAAKLKTTPAFQLARGKFYAAKFQAEEV